MTTKVDSVVGISSFNNAETIASCRLWRRKVINKEAASAFRTSGSLTAACTAIRRRAIHLNRQIGSRNDSKNPKPSKSSSGEDFSAIHELIRLVGNVTFFDVLCRLTVKDADVVQHLGALLEHGDMKKDTAASIMRLFGNLCESKESAASVLQTKPCVRMIVHWLVKNLDEDLLRDQAETAAVPKRDKSDDRVQGEKLREQCIRALRNAAACGKNFAQNLIRSEAVYAVGRYVRTFLDGNGKRQGPKNIRDSAFQFLHLLLPFKDHNFSQQILRADILEKLMETVRATPESNAKANSSVTKLILGMITHYSSLRCELSKFGAIDWAKERIEKMMDDEKWPEDISKDDSIGGEILIALIRFCRDAYTRAKLRETRGLDLLLKIFIAGDLQEMKFINELMSAFLCFLYDDQGLKYLVEYDGFLVSVVRIVERFSVDYPCTATHFLKAEEEEKDKEEPTSTTAACVNPVSFHFRADSPSYKRFRLDPSAASSSVDGDAGTYEGPLCKDFKAAQNLNGWSSPSTSSFKNMRSPSSPGPSWSPSASSLNSLSSIGSTSPPLGGSKSSNDFCWSPTSDNFRGTDDWEYDWIEFGSGRRESISSQDHVPSALCECKSPSADSSFKDRERLLWAAVKLLSWLSHGVHASLLVTANFLAVLLSYVGGVCRPEPRIGRLIERLTRNRQFTESLLALEFHRRVYDGLCVMKCDGGNESKKQCCRCRKLCKIGCGILKSFRAQVDTDFGFGTLEHMMATGDEKMKLLCFCAMLYLASSNRRVRRLMSGHDGGLSVLVNVLSSDAGDHETQVMVVKAIYAGIDRDALHERFIRLKTSVVDATACVFEADVINDENRVTFLENGGDGRIECNTELLTALSPFYRAMFSGSYSESSQRHFVISNSNFSSFVYYVHYLHGCRNCDRATVNSACECLSVLELADKKLCCSLGEFVVNDMVGKVLRIDNEVDFISNSILRRDLVLFKLCTDFLLALGTVEEFLNILTVFRSSTLGVEFFVMLTNYLKCEYKFE